MIRCARAALAATCLVAASAAAALPSYGEFRAAHRPSDLTLLDRHGVPIQTLRVDNTVRLNNPGRFALPPTRVEAMYAPESFSELPNASLEVAP